MKTIFAITALILSLSNLYAGNIMGRVTDAQTGEALPSATIYIENTSRGLISDIRGEYTISGIKAGVHTITFSYVGYEKQSREIEVGDETITLDIALSMLSIQGEEVLVTAQAAGQRAAINQQVNSNSVMNVVSAQRIQEIPESSAAEAVGRLPGVSLKGGSIVVRGLSPHYNKIQVDGIDMASTSSSNRSSSLDMISQYMLEGIEMTKTAMADQDADVLGARVNLLIKEAPKGQRVEAIFQNGYNSLSSSLGNQRISVSGSNRFFDNKLGVFIQGSFDRSNWATNAMNAHYSMNAQINEEGLPTLTGMSLTDTKGKLIGRKGLSMVLDYRTGLTKIKSSNFISSSEKETTRHALSYGLESLNEGRNINLQKSDLLVMTNSLRVEQILGRFEIDAGLNHAYSENINPGSISVGGTDIGALSTDNRDSLTMLHPLEIPGNFNMNTEEAYMGKYNYNNTFNKERNLTAFINARANFKLAEKISLDIKFGAKYKYISKNNDNEFYEAQTNQAYFNQTSKVAPNYVDWLPKGEDLGSPEGGLIGMRYFIDPTYYNDEFLLGSTEINNVLNEERIRDFHNFLWDNPMGLEMAKGQPYYKVWEQSFANDYYGHENYLGTYFMPTLTIGRNKMLTIIPGVRYEKNNTSYTGFRLPQTSSMDREAIRNYFADYNFTRERENEYFLPMLHLIYRPVKWAVFKTSYTHTLSRPQFRNLVPSWNVGSDVIYWNNPYLEPALSKNLDINLSIHGSKIGLLTAGVFRKDIVDLIFPHGETKILQEDLDANMYDGLEENNEYTLVNAAGFKVNYQMNNPQPSYVRGLELEYQSNFYFLPGILNGLVLNANYTLFDSNAKYPSTNRILDYQTFQYTYVDTFYEARILDQARHIFNVMLGFDYKEFSIRSSLKYTDDLFSGNNETPSMRRDTDARIDIDLSAKQNFPKIGLSVFGNVTNLTRSKYVVLNRGTGYPTAESYGGIGVEIGLRYRFVKL